MEISLSQIKMGYLTVATHQEENPFIRNLISKLHLLPHPEGGYYVETDRSPLRVPNPFREPGDDKDTTRSASTVIYYLLTPVTPLGVFHRNKGRTVHTWHHGRGRYVIIHADEVEGSGAETAKARIETFVVGPDLARGERMQWIVDGGKYKASFLLDSPEDGKHPSADSSGLLISEVVIPGFEFTDHDFLPREKMERLLAPEQVQQLSWMLKKNE